MKQDFKPIHGVQPQRRPDGNVADVNLMPAFVWIVIGTPGEVLIEACQTEAGTFHQRNSNAHLGVDLPTLKFITD